MVEYSARPRCCRVAERTVGWEPRLDVIGIRGPVVILDVATVAIGGRAGKFAVDVAQIARDADVRAGEWERSLRVVKDRASPRRRRMAERAIRGESSLNVIGVRGALIVLRMATVAIGWRAGKLAVDVALRAGHADMRSRQRELREFVVIEHGASPGRSVVAGGAVPGEASLNVIGIRGPVVILDVAAITIRRCSRKVSADVTGSALQVGVRSRQREACEFQVIKLRAKPSVRGVAALAGRGESQGFVIRGRRLLKIAGVTRQARGG
jgi:hypothetical protein